MKAPLFVKVDLYREIMDTVGHIKEKLQAAEETLKKIRELKHREDEQIGAWQSEIESIGQKLSAISNDLSDNETQQ